MVVSLGSRRAIAWVMLALYGLIASGLPVPLGGFSGDAHSTGRLTAKDRSRPFPCMNKPCGCRSAQQCFNDCCCHTPAETLAWAKARGLEPAVLAALASRVAAAATAPVPAGCCSTPAGCGDRAETATGCDTPAVDAAVCSDYQSLAADPVEPEADQILPATRGQHDHEPEPTDVVILRAMLACGGIVSQWTAVATSLPAPLPIACDLPCPLVGYVVLTDQRIIPGGGPPETPPPKA
jgi:hypothetical protein